jgi:type IV secretory pathway VirB9-like protein
MTMKKMMATALVLAFTSGAHAAGIIDETAGPAPAVGPAGGLGGAAENRAMRTSVTLNAIQAAFDDSDPRDNIEFFTYDRATIYKLRLREFMAATVVLPKGESIAAYQLADDKNFTFIPYAGSKDKKKPDPDGLENVFSIRPTHPGADTSLTVIGRSGRLYSFYLRVDSVTSAHMPVLTAYIEDRAAEFTRPGETSRPATSEAGQGGDQPPAEAGGKPAKMTGEDAAAEAEYLRSLPVVDVTKINLDGYKIAGGDKELAPLKVFDDGYWTYFKLSNDKNLDRARVPAIYRVVDGYDTPVNTRVEGGTVIAETLSKGWTLRRGEAHICVRAK